MRILFLILFLLSTPALAEPAAISFVLRDDVGRVDWHSDGRIAFDRFMDGWFQVWTMEDNTTRQECLTCGRRFPKLHNGNPAWHPSGKYIVYQSLDDKIKVPMWGSLYKLYTGPGAGVNNNIWVVAASGKGAWQLTDLGKGKGVLHPHFSHDGIKLLWAEMTSTKPMPTGQWVMKLADFAEARGRPVISNIRTLTPGDMQWYETHSFSPDDSTILFTGLRKDKQNKHFDIYKYSLADETLTVLTDEKKEIWDEHAQFSPDGTKIIWMSSEDNNGSQKGAFVKTDWWLMDADGGNKRRLTWFNKPGSPHYIKGKAIAADVSWSPDGKEVIGYLQDNATMEKPGSIVRFKVE